eukprot:scaffold129570_cov31-Tisochrysis_lutea.AAC.4
MAARMLPLVISLEGSGMVAASGPSRSTADDLPAEPPLPMSAEREWMRGDEGAQKDPLSPPPSVLSLLLSFSLGRGERRETTERELSPGGAGLSLP